MSTSRRGFLSGILAMGMAPAIVKAESIMLINPRQGLILPSLRGSTTSLIHLDESPFFDPEVHRKLGEVMAEGMHRQMNRPGFMRTMVSRLTPSQLRSMGITRS